MAMVEKADVWELREVGMKKRQKQQKLGVRDNRDKDEIQKETKRRFGEKRVLEMWPRVKRLQILKVHQVLDPQLRLPRGQAPKGSKISRKGPGPKPNCLACGQKHWFRDYP